MRDHLRKLAGLRHFLRPEGITTADEFNAHIDTVVRVLEGCRVDSESAPVPKTREELGGRDRQERGGRKRGKKQALTSDMFGGENSDTSEARHGEDSD